MADDALVEAPFCVVCRRSSAVKWRKHVFSRGHQQAAQQFLLMQADRLQELCDAATLASDRWRCVFCDAAWATGDALAHLGSEAHKKQVEGFCRWHRCDADRQTRPQLWLRAARRRELEAALAKRETGEQEKKQGGEQQEEQVDAADQAASKRVEAFLSSAASRLQEVQTDRRRTVMESSAAVDMKTRVQQQEALLGPQMTVVRRCKTLASPEGVLQNPLGRHEGKRVWGGGIVKLRKAEWIPWAIDQLVKEEQGDNPETQQTGTNSTAFAHRVTELARGHGLSSIASVSWGAGVGNVHTSAVPPWMVQTEEEYKNCNRREQAAPAPTRPNNKAQATDKKRRDIFSELQSKSEYGPDWLPNFGGVWQEGPRSKTKQVFRKAASTAKPSRDRVPARPTEPSPSQLPMQATIALVSPVTSRRTRPPPLPPSLLPQQSAVHHSVPAELHPKPQHEASMLPPPGPSGTQDVKGKTENSIDAKKQLLLAQKERLRAKMAARRRN